MPNRLSAAAALSLVASLGSASGASAADGLPDWAPQPRPNVIEDRLRVEVNLLGAGVDTDLRVDETLSVRGTQINAEDDLGLDDFKLLPQVEFTLLPGEHHLLRLSALAVHRTAQKTLERNISFDDEDYLIRERVDSKLDLTMFGLTYGYRFLVHPRSEITATFGVQIAEVEANAVVRSRVVREAESGVAPLPLAGIEGRFDFTPRWSVEARAQYLTAHIEEVDGSILDARLAFTWRINPYLVLGAGYRTFAVDVESEDEGTPGSVDIDVTGPLLFIRASL